MLTRLICRLVLETLTPLDGERKCFRLINGVLVERTVSDVVPLLQTNAEGLKKVLEELVKTYKSKENELEKWKVCLPLLAPPGPSSPPPLLPTRNLQVSNPPTIEEEQNPSSSVGLRNVWDVGRERKWVKVKMQKFMETRHIRGNENICFALTSGG